MAAEEGNGNITNYVDFCMITCSFVQRHQIHCEPLRARRCSSPSGAVGRLGLRVGLQLQGFRKERVMCFVSWGSWKSLAGPRFPGSCVPSDWGS